MQFKFFNCPRDLTLYATDEPMIYTVHDALSFVGRAPYPIWDMENIEIVTAAHEWRICGFWRGDGRSVSQVGFHVPPEVAREMQDWLNDYVLRNPRAPLIPRCAGKTGRPLLCTYDELAATIKTHSPRNYAHA